MSAGKFLHLQIPYGKRFPTFRAWRNSGEGRGWFRPVQAASNSIRLSGGSTCATRANGALSTNVTTTRANGALSMSMTTTRANRAACAHTLIHHLRGLVPNGPRAGSGLQPRHWGLLPYSFYEFFSPSSGFS